MQKKSKSSTTYDPLIPRVAPVQITHWTQLKTPFPTSKCAKHLPSPASSTPNTTFTLSSLIAFPTSKDDRGGVTYNGQDYTASQYSQYLALLNTTYPAHNEDRRPATFEAKSIKMANLKNDRDKEISVSQCKSVGKELCTKAHQFRLDRYGNVISAKATTGALTSYDVDHIFPWSRGGRTLPNNLEAIQTYANSSVKNSKLLQSLSLEKMNCGVTLQQLTDLMEYCGERARQEGGSRRDTTAYKEMVADWLTAGPFKKESLGGRWCEVTGKSAEETFEWLRYNSRHEIMKRRQLERQRNMSKKLTSDNAPIELVVVHQTGCIELVADTVTKQITDVTKRQFFTGKSIWVRLGFFFYGGKNQKWVKAVSNDGERGDIMEEIRLILDDFKSFGMKEVDRRAKKKVQHGKRMSGSGMPPLMKRTVTA
ncbi:hypothetical protein TrLO_g9864 [Triparma laevis f. longispina]|nr:hypothetical protein TrLO_g9864 [Triparma laevis f. longispina]